MTTKLAMHINKGQYFFIAKHILHRITKKMYLSLGRFLEKLKVYQRLIIKLFYLYFYQTVNIFFA